MNFEKTVSTEIKINMKKLILYKFMEKLKQNCFYINYSRMWLYVKPVWFRALCSMFICIQIGIIGCSNCSCLKTIYGFGYG